MEKWLADTHAIKYKFPEADRKADGKPVQESKVCNATHKQQQGMLISQDPHSAWSSTIKGHQLKTANLIMDELAAKMLSVVLDNERVSTRLSTEAKSLYTKKIKAQR